LNFMVAEQFNQEPAKVASIVLIGNVLSVIFVPLGVALALR
ncbi:MAG: AEC family transporter, partial [Betaproteobacteria bacterium]|nr:AEC family transporter [Betaproteobacteria bacterium]